MMLADGPSSCSIIQLSAQRRHSYMQEIVIWFRFHVTQQSPENAFQRYFSLKQPKLTCSKTMNCCNLLLRVMTGFMTQKIFRCLYYLCHKHISKPSVGIKLLTMAGSVPIFSTISYRRFKKFPCWRMPRCPSFTFSGFVLPLQNLRIHRWVRP